MASKMELEDQYSVDRLYTVDQNRLYTVDQNRLYTVDQNKLYALDQNKLYTVEQNNAVVALNMEIDSGETSSIGLHDQLKVPPTLLPSFFRPSPLLRHLSLRPILLSRKAWVYKFKPGSG